MDDYDKIRKAEELAALRMVEYGKSSRIDPTSEEVDAVEACMEAAGCNEGNFRADRRRLEVWPILTLCITPTDSYELRKIRAALLAIAARSPQILGSKQ